MPPDLNSNLERMALIKETVPGSLGAFFQGLAGNAWRRDVLKSPPDVFALSAAVLDLTGAYLAVVTKWPPQSYTRDEWRDSVQEIGRLWGSKWRTTNKIPPKQVQRLWATVGKDANLPLSKLFDLDYSRVASRRASRAQRVCRCLLELLAIADEACAGVGIPGDDGTFELGGIEESVALDLYMQFIDDSPSTLCKYIDPSKASILPKLHTPQTGITVRSLSHNLALNLASEVRVGWVWGSPLSGGGSRHGLNILLVPWPDSIVPSDFSPTNPRCGDLKDMDSSKHAFFRFCGAERRQLSAPHLMSIISKAQKKVGFIDAVVLPELSMTEAALKRIAKRLAVIRPHPPIIIAGVSVPHSADRVRNLSITLMPYEDPLKPGKFTYSKFEQAKHHRWKLDARQIEQYGLGGILDPTLLWWENSQVPRRELLFMSINPWLTMCTLLCEDLARPDPIANIVRAVGPNLVVALLLDGPQLANRWPARYGTVLADDPGSSVLTVTNLGMAELSRARDKPVSRVIALWKDMHGGAPTEITLPAEKEGVVLCVTRKRCLEYTADNRGDGEAAAHLNLSGTHVV